MTTVVIAQEFITDLERSNAELLAALRECVAQGDLPESYESFHGRLERARAAIAKAVQS